MRFPGFKGEWGNITLGDCAESLDYGMNAAAMKFDGENRYIRITDIDEGSSAYKSETPVSPNADLSDKYLVQEGDILFARTGAGTGRSYLYNIKDGKLYFAGFLIRARIKKDYNAYFIFTQTQTLKYDKWVKLMSMRSGQPGINSQEYASFKFKIPTKAEQDKISQLLTLIDSRIQTQNKIIGQLETSIRDFRNQIFQQKLRFKNKMLLDFPEWDIKKLGEIAYKRNQKNKDLSIKVVFSNSANLGIINQTDFFDKEIANQNNIDSYYIVEKNDFVYNPRISKEAPVGPISRNKIATGVMSPLYMVLRFKEGSVDFFEHFFKSNVWHEHMESIANYGARADRMSFSNSDFFEMPVPTPIIEEQIEIANFLYHLEQKNEIEKQILKGYEDQKQYLLQNLFI